MELKAEKGQLFFKTTPIQLNWKIWWNWFKQIRWPIDIGVVDKRSETQRLVD